MAASNKELRELLESEIPKELATLEDSAANLERVAAYCEANYAQAQNKKAAFDETKKLTLQSLASVAYYINTISTSLLRSIELESENIAQKASEVHNIDQIIGIHKEKIARREIGKLTINKTVLKQNKITYPMTQEKTPRYQRCAIDYTILDNIGHGAKTVDYMNPKVLVNRSVSMVSGDSSMNSHSQNNYEQFNPKYGHTLTRNSIRSVNEHYRVPQVPQSVLDLQRFSTMTNRNSNIPYMDSASTHYGQVGQMAMRDAPPPPPPQASITQYGLPPIESPDHLFPTPPMSMMMHPDDEPLPPPPFVANSNSLPIQNNHSVPEWVPNNFIEKAVVIYDYDAEKADELTLREHCVVYILRKNDDGWYEGVLDGLTGLFPGNYVQAIQ
uniref:SH3 domain-containing protein n=1 Tax=Acrobeloides nanus TaxID=290746 RepID=A0A914DQG3_9BILA